jgi:hypothetical protein
MDIDEQVKRQLDAVVGEEYRPPRSARDLVAKWLGAAVLAVAAAALVMGILHRYMSAAETAPAPKKPVSVTILPAK